VSGGDGREQLRIEPRQAGKGLGINSISFARVVIDRSQLTSIGDKHIMPQFSKQVAHPAEWAPTSVATRHAGRLENLRGNAARVVGRRASSIASRFESRMTT